MFNSYVVPKDPPRYEVIAVTFIWPSETAHIDDKGKNGI